MTAQTSMLAEVVDVGRVVGKLRTLASAPENRPFIARDKGCVSGLAGFLANHSNDVVFAALETIRLLALHPQGLEALQKESLLSSNLQSLADAENRTTSIQNLAQQILGTLEGSTATDENENAAARNGKASTPSKQHKGKTNRKAFGPNNGAHLSSPAKGGVSTPPRVKKPAATIKVIVGGLPDEDAKETVEAAVIRVRGVVSVCMGQPKQEPAKGMLWRTQSGLWEVSVTIRMHCDSEAIKTKMEKLGYTMRIYERSTAKQTIKEEAPGTPLTCATSASPGASSSPQYLTPPTPEQGHAVAVAGDVAGMSVAERLAEQKKRAEAEGGWLSKVGRALWLM